MKVENITGDKSLDFWLDFFSKENKKNRRFQYLLKKRDTYFLTVSPPQKDEIEGFPDHGVLENDFRVVAFHNEKENMEQKTRLVMAIYYNVNLKPWKKIYKDLFYEVIEKSILDGDYERYGIEIEKVLAIAMKKEYIMKDDFVSISLLRGMLMAKRYDNKEKENLLKKEQRKNAFLVFLGI